MESLSHASMIAAFSKAIPVVVSGVLQRWIYGSLGREIATLAMKGMQKRQK